MTLFVANRWVAGAGAEVVARDPVTGEVAWRGAGASAEQVEEAVAAARAAAGAWSALTRDERISFVQRFAEVLRDQREVMARAISAETGKPRWEAMSEVDAMVGKAGLSIEAAAQRQAESSVAVGDAKGVTRYKPHGVLGVLGPFNMPGHLPNGHIMPALVAGNTVVFKPSEQTPGVGEMMVKLWEQVGLPAGVVNLVQGGRDVGEALAKSPGLDGLLFTGSFAAGRALARLYAERPGKMLALEMGGNNPLVVWDVRDVNAAAYLAAVSAYITAGQRCTCARRLIVRAGDEGERVVARVAEVARRVQVGGPGDEPEPFMGPVISRRAAERLLEAERDLLSRGGLQIVKLERVETGGGAMLRPGVIDVTGVRDRVDEELFGPLLQVVRVSTFDAAIEEANATQYGLAAGLLSDRRELFEQFYRHVRAGVVMWNRQTTQASGRLPFGGVGRSGNHRPSGFFAADYTAYPVASLERDELVMPETKLTGIDT